MPTAAPARCRPLPWRFPPAQALSRWPAQQPLALLWSGDPAPDARAWSRWTILARPIATEMPTDLASLGRLFDRHRVRAAARANQPPFLGGWIGMCGYPLGRQLEPTARHGRGPRADVAWPTMLWQRCAAAYAHDAHSGRWWQVGEPAAGVLLPDLAELPAMPMPPYRLGTLRSSMGAKAYQRAVERALEYIRAGDVFQVNLAHRMRAPFDGSTRALLADLLQASRPRYGAYLRWPGRCMVSVSPELFLQWAPDGGIVTRPMKGTRPGGASPDELRRNPKDCAELSMIVDLMRNDIGRVSRIGSVRVQAARVIERHGAARRTAPGPHAAGVLQATATVAGVLAGGVGATDVLRAAFPPGSVTGAPKIRAMQIIEELEQVQRGPYCGAIGFVSDHGAAAFSVAIRTALVSGREDPEGVFARGSKLDWYVGAGIVADSQARAEWNETLDKAGVIAGLQQRERKGS